MISKPTIARIQDTARIEEVVGDFLTLKKRGINYIACCPFHNEKTPSFNVNPVRNIYKCFGCGKGGDAISFVMEHEKLTYPESLRYLAKKYNIEIEELYDRNIEEEKKQESERESLYVVCSYAQKYFSESLHATDEGKSIGLSYFKERGLSDEIIQKFQLGYSSEKRTAFTEAALKAGYNLDYLVKAGLTIKPESEGVEGGWGNNPFDRYSARVIFPIHNITGRVIGFGGRALKKEAKAKYINSPETDIYHKSTVLYGMPFARKTISTEDNCYLVEGYMDVTSMHQSGIENVVASSGTSLTVEQIRLIKRYTSNITIMYDGDPAGIKASFRGIDMILAEGLNVRVVLFPEGDDPDSYSRKHSESELKTFIKEHTTDFIRFKTQLLYSDSQDDPIKKASLIQEIVESISLIPNSITRTVFIQECSKIMKMDEQSLLTELNKALRKRYSKRTNEPQFEEVIELDNTLIPQPVDTDKYSCEIPEKELIRILLNYGNEVVVCETTQTDENGDIKHAETDISVTELIITHLLTDNMEFEYSLYQSIFLNYVDARKNDTLLSSDYFLRHPDKSLTQIAVDLITSQHTLSDWGKKDVIVKTEKDDLKLTAEEVIYSLKSKKVMKKKIEIQIQIKEAEAKSDWDLVFTLQREEMHWDSIKNIFAKELRRVVIS